MARQKEEILFEWVAPKAVAIESARPLKKYYGRTVFPRAFIIITVLLAVLYFVFDYLFPADIHFNLLNAFLKVWLLGSGLLVFGLLIYPWLLMFDRTRYRITNKHVRIVSGNNSRILKWQDLTGYVLTESQTVPGQRDITLLTDSFPRVIHLPEDSLAEQIIQYVAGRLPVFQSIPTLTYPTEFTFLQKCCFAICTILYSGAVAYWIVFGGEHFLQKNIEFALILILLFGPGTICSIGMFGLPFFKNKWFKVRAILINFMGLTLFMLFDIIFLFWQLKKEGGW